ncbi:hypothetical protein HU200_035247 [Digitaria exilis]|uniref:POX domain-containing protein n=1 Tax=Digitaria exilis TaxID=1010633 RepID=A0A835BIR8_9POAL|nr:hypothetical protein HU200_035247 [Digitaria exilis]
MTVTWTLPRIEVGPRWAPSWPPTGCFLMAFSWQPWATDILLDRLPGPTVGGSGPGSQAPSESLLTIPGAVAGRSSKQQEHARLGLGRVRGGSAIVQGGPALPCPARAHAIQDSKCARLLAKHARWSTSVVVQVSKWDRASYTGLISERAEYMSTTGPRSPHRLARKSYGPELSLAPRCVVIAADAAAAPRPRRFLFFLSSAPQGLFVQRMAHDPSLAYADYFAAAAGGGVTTLVPEVVDAGDDDAGDHLHLYGGVQAHHQHGLDMFGIRGLMPVGAHGKAAALGEFALAEHHHHLGGHNNQAPLMTSLSLHGPADAAAALALHHHQQQQLGVSALGGLHHEWPSQHQQGAAGWHLRGSRFLRPTQQLLQEFCSLPVEDASNSKPPTTTTKPASEDGGGAGEGSSSSPPSAQIQAMDAAELQRLKAKLYAMLQEVRSVLLSSLIAHHSQLAITEYSTATCEAGDDRHGQLIPFWDLTSPSAFGNLQSSILPLAADVATRQYRPITVQRAAAQDSAELAGLHRSTASPLSPLYRQPLVVERRYRRYREQMRAVAGSFEAVAGERAAAAYTRLASRTISKHFRSLRDGVAAQMQAVRRALGEKDTDGGPAAAGTMAIKGETTPRLRVLDQCLRQHRAYQAGVLESQPWRPQRGLPERAVSILRAWLFEHFLHPDVDKHILARQTGLSRSQSTVSVSTLVRANVARRKGILSTTNVSCARPPRVGVSNWFINARVRLWKPMVEEMYNEEMKDPQQEGSCSNANNNNANPSSYSASELGQQGRSGGASGADQEGGERKPTPAQLVVHDAGSLASVVSIGSSRDPQNINFDSMMDGHIDFGAYNDDHHHGFGAATGGGVSLTLGLQQHADDPHGGVNVAFAAGTTSSAAHEFLFMAGGEQQQMVAGGGVHHGHQGQFVGAGMEGDAVAASHYHRGLSAAATGFQLLHDLAG